MRTDFRQFRPQCDPGSRSDAHPYKYAFPATRSCRCRQSEFRFVSPFRRPTAHSRSVRHARTRRRQLNQPEESLLLERDPTPYARLSSTIELASFAINYLLEAVVK